VNAKQEALVDALWKDYPDPQDILGEQGVLKHRTKRGVERVLEAELTAHLGSALQERHGTQAGKARHGKGQKTVPTDTGPLALAVPRDRHGSLAPQRVPKRQRRLEGVDDKVLRWYARGRSPRDSQGPLEARYGTEVSPTRIAAITDAVVDEVRPWPSRPRAAG
jgi:putative transposase